ncbi:MAG: PilT/PilU family type 4a pilus ATPase [Candidatus Electryonea clarkiae]|nr:PilT/PilU family type 4a pilus ATPase [Candidatus Electryonea clarkiae]MDP8288524.1 PilT/PilU family type 4a pilus ATPase [Candidatus Electryonea clarkiae]
MPEVKQLLQNLTSRIPKALPAEERHHFISKDIINNLSDEERSSLKGFFDTSLNLMRKLGASDIDLGGWGAKDRIWFRIQGVKTPVEELGEYSVEQTDTIIQSILSEKQRDFLIENKSLDISYHYRGEHGSINRQRATCYLDMGAIALNMRAISTEIRPYSSFGFHANVARFHSLVHTKEGLVLVTGLTGSGKSSTLDAIVDLNNQSIDAHIIIIASPVEFVHSSRRCIIRHREVGRDTMSFKHGTIEALRQDPDIIVIGEMRDAETIMSALEVADSGHKVLSTLHTSSAIESIDRIIGEVPVLEQDRVRNRLGDVLRCVISQKLVPGKDGKRVLAKEIMLMASNIRAAIKNNNTGEIYQMMREGVKYGMTTMEQDLKRLVTTKKISKEVAMNYSNNKKMMKQLLQSMV